MRASILILFLFMCSCDAQDDARRALDDARRLAKEGDYEGALARHVWFHDHALSVRPSYYGVRLSFALSDWIQLGSKFPKALDTLRGIRDAKSSKLLAGDANRELFHDVESINEHLSESKETVNLFKRIEAANPVFARTIFDLADSALLEAREYRLARQYLGDPKERLAAAKQKFDEGMKYSKTSKSGEASRRAFESIFADEVVRLVVVLDQTEDNAAAKSVQSEALKILDHEKIRNALEP